VFYGNKIAFIFFGDAKVHLQTAAPWKQEDQAEHN